MGLEAVTRRCYIRVVSRGSAGIGRQAWLRTMCRKTSGFKSPLPHQGLATEQGKREKLERKTGFGPATSSLARRHSTAELLPLLSDGAEDQNRTGDTWIFSPLLYRLSYLGTTIIVTVSRISVKEAETTRSVG